MGSKDGGRGKESMDGFEAVGCATRKEMKRVGDRCKR
jgi:hypothetical protein